MNPYHRHIIFIAFSFDQRSEAVAGQFANVGPMGGTEVRGAREVLYPSGDGRSCPCTLSLSKSIIFGHFGSLYSSVQSRHTYSLNLVAPQVLLNANIDIDALRGIRLPVDALDIPLVVPYMSTYGRGGWCRDWYRNSSQW